MNLLLCVCQATFDWVWKTSVSAAILAALVFLVQWALGKRLTPRLHYALSLLVLIRLLMPVLPVSPFSLENILPQKTRISQPALHVMPVSNPTAPTPAMAIIANSPTPLPTPAKSSNTLGIFCALWLLGCLLLVLLARWRYSKWVRWIDEGEIISDPKLLAILDGARKDMRVRWSVKIVAIPQVGSPAVFGIWNIRLLLPENIMRDLSDEDLRLIFRHEMAHVRRYDVLLNTVLMAVQFLHWFNPVVWFALHRIRADRETICDEMVMRHTEAEERVRYGRLLLKLAEEFPAGQRLLPNTATVVGSQHEIKRRIIMIKNHGKKHLASGALAIIAIAFLGCAAFTRAQNTTPTQTDSSTSLASQLIGTWVLEREDGPQSQPSGVGTRMKNFTGTHWNIIQPDPKTGAIIFDQGGTYKIEGDKYFERKDFAGENNQGGMGKTGEFTLKIEGDKLIQKGINNPWNEVWKRVK
ncbi:MAG TPA: M56 family metallopeptidase [Verrucomicrobiae bacterium]|nr:M56 family metallopeptidase [Verrucomicrobiae bacterium]